MDEEQSHSPVPPRKDEPMQYSFIDALKFVMEGKRITKLEWRNHNIYGFMRDGILTLHKEDDKVYQWILSDGDLSGEDWIVLNG